MQEKVKQIVDYVNQKLKQHCEKQKENVRQVSETDIVGYLNDSDYQKSSNPQEVLDFTTNMAINTPPNYDTEREVIYSGKLYMIINRWQAQQISELLKIAQQNNIELTGDQIPMGAFATDDERILLVKTEEEARAIVDLTKYFKPDIYAIIELEAHEAKAIFSLIGAQFGFEENKYYKASKVNQYEFKKEFPNERKKLVLKRVHNLEELYRKNKD